MPGMSMRPGGCRGYMVIALGGDLGAACAAWLSGSLATVISAGSRIIIDVAGLDFIDCDALSELRAARKRALQAGGDLRLAGARQSVQRILSLVDTGGLLPTFTSVREAALRCPALPGAGSGTEAADWAGMTGPAQPGRPGAPTS